MVIPNNRIMGCCTYCNKPVENNEMLRSLKEFEEAIHEVCFCLRKAKARRLHIGVGVGAESIVRYSKVPERYTNPYWKLDKDICRLNNEIDGRIKGIEIFENEEKVIPAKKKPSMS